MAGGRLYLCYLDESGTDERSSVTTMVGLLVDGTRHGRSSDLFRDLLVQGGDAARAGFSEFKGVDLYRGNGKWYGVDPDLRKEFLSRMVQFASERRHQLILSSIDKERFDETSCPPSVAGDARGVCAWHALIQLQRHQRPKKKNKGATLVLFDEHRDNDDLAADVIEPADDVDAFAGRRPKEVPFSCVVEAPLSVRSDRFGMTQIADVCAFVFRRFAELEIGGAPYHADERETMSNWVSQLRPQLLPRSCVWPSKNAGKLPTWFRDVAAQPLVHLYN